MDFILDSLFISLIILCLLLLYRLIKQRVLNKNKPISGHAVLLPIEFSGTEPREIVLKYELPTQSKVSIVLYDASNQFIALVFEKEQKAGDYYLKELLPEIGSLFYLEFTSNNTKVLRKIQIP